MRLCPHVLIVATCCFYRDLSVDVYSNDCSSLICGTAIGGSGISVIRGLLTSIGLKPQVTAGIGPPKEPAE